MDKAVFKNLITSAQPNPVENTMLERDIVVLMDMPGLYLPPQSQSKLLEYFRSIVRKENENIQFIIVTNSSALIDKATPEELFMLIPSQQLAEGSNQLVKVSDPNMCLAHF